MTKLQGNYTIYVPGGNNTALVEGLNFSPEQRKKINDFIMQENPEVEQVGFVEKNRVVRELKMAGGEFCGNATRSAAHFYMNGLTGEIMIKVNDKFVSAGVDDYGAAWCDIPLIDDTSKMVENIEDGVYKVLMNGMVTLVILEEQASKYLLDKSCIKQEAMKLIEKFDLKYSEAVGVMFLENIEGVLKINPVVWVKAIDTLFYETACGSGTTATAAVKSFLTGKDGNFKILQPSGYVITAVVSYEKECIKNVRISGAIGTDNIQRKFEILE